MNKRFILASTSSEAISTKPFTIRCLEKYLKKNVGDNLSAFGKGYAPTHFYAKLVLNVDSEKSYEKYL